MCIRDRAGTYTDFSSRYNSDASYMRFVMKASATPVYAMTIRGSGKIGIGTTDPDYILTTQGSGVQRLKIVATDPSQHSAGVFFVVKNGASQVGTGTIATQNNGDMDFYTGSTSESIKMRLTAGGNLGIGNTSPYSRLDLNGVLSIGPASLDPSFTVTSTDVSTIAGGSLELVQGFGGTTSSGDTIVFTYEAQSWKAFQYEYCISAAYGLSKGGGGGYNNNGMSSYYYVTTNQGSNVNVTSVVSNSGGPSNQYVIVTITGVFGIHPCVSFKYTQSGGDGAPRADRATLAFNS